MQKVSMSQKQFRIGDLAKELKVKKFVVRFWEREFGIKSDRSQGGQRFYTSDDLKTFLTIKDLLYNQGFTIAGAKKQLYAISKGKSAAIEAGDLVQQEHPHTMPSVGEATATPVNAVPQDDGELDKNSNDCEHDVQTSEPVDMICTGGALVAQNQQENTKPDESEQQPPHLQEATFISEEKITPATVVASCNCQDVLQKLHALKQQLLGLKMQLEDPTPYQPLN